MSEPLELKLRVLTSHPMTFLGTLESQGPNLCYEDGQRALLPAGPSFSIAINVNVHKNSFGRHFNFLWSIQKHKRVFPRGLKRCFQIKVMEIVTLIE